MATDSVELSCILIKIYLVNPSHTYDTGASAQGNEDSSDSRDVEGDEALNA